MSHFYGTMNNGINRPRTIRGHKTQGLTAHVRGWGLGVQVDLFERDGKDWARVYITAGSTGNGYMVNVWEGTREAYDRLQEKREA